MDLNTQGLIVNKIAIEIQKLLNERGRRYRFHQNTPVLYEIQSNETLHEYRVNLAQHTCSCKAWQSTGYPCGHALAIILHRRENPQIYVATFYTLTTFHDTYENPIIHPLSNEDNPPADPLPPNIREIDIEDETDSDNSSDESDESEDDLLPPTVRRQPGRPRKVRQDKLKKSRGAIKKVQRCGLCRQVGHSGRTCKEPID